MMPMLQAHGPRPEHLLAPLSATLEIEFERDSNQISSRKMTAFPSSGDGLPVEYKVRRDLPLFLLLECFCNALLPL